MKEARYRKEQEMIRKCWRREIWADPWRWKD